MATSSPHGSEDPARRGLRVRALSVALFVLLLTGSVGVAFLAREVIDDQERRLLTQRAGEAAALLGNLISQVEVSLRSTATVAEVTDGDPGIFTDTATSHSSGVEQVALVEERDGRFVVRAATAGELAPDQELTGPRAAALRRAGPANGLVSTSVFSSGGQRRLGFALAAATTPVPLLVYQESPVAPTGSAQAVESDPFSELKGAVYAAPRVDHDQDVLSSSTLPIKGETVIHPVQAGTEQWTLEAAARRPLVGALAKNEPWLLLGAGFLLTLLVPLLIEALLRRRAYAMTLVEERTAELEQSLRELDSVQKELIDKERLAAIGQLSSAVGHELRNPLGVISNVLYLLRTRLGADEWTARQLQTAEREVGAATLIVSDLLEFARPRPPVPSATAVAAVLDEVLSVAHPPTGVEVAGLDQTDPTVRVLADRDQLRQVLLNLVVNAYQAMPDGGVLTFGVDQTADGGVSIIVADTGVGMDDSVRQRLFEPFFTTKMKGIGLGLVVTKRIVEAHGGTVDVVSRPGAGTTFAVTLPAVMDLAEVNR